MSVDFTYPDADRYMRRRRIGLALRRLKLRPPENLNLAQIERGTRELNNAIENGLTQRPTGFDDPAALRQSILDYARGRGEGGSDHSFYPHLLFSEISAAIDPTIRTVINLGAFFANVDATLALLYPEVKFLAVDRGAAFREINESVFCAKNLAFIDSEIEPVISGLSERPAILAHCKTATYLYPKKLQNIYDIAAANGVRFIVGVENTGFCLETRDFYEFTTEPKKSAFYKTALFVHNYPAMLKQAGYRMRSGRIAFNGENHAVVFTAELTRS